MKFKINNYESYKSAIKEKEKALEEIKNTFIIEKTVSSSKITLNILELIRNKLNSIKIQKENKEIRILENEYKENVKNLDTKIFNMNKEVEDILALITSSISKNKRVEKITETKIANKENEFVAYLENGVQFKLTLDSDIELAKRYLEINKELKDISKDKNNLYEILNKEIKKINKEYVEWDFNEYIKEINNFSKFEFCNIYEFKENQFVNFYGNNLDFEKYKKILFEIETILKDVERIDKEFTNQLDL